MEIKKFLEFLSPFAILLVIIVERRLSLLKNEGSVVMKRLAARLLSLMGVFVLCLGVMGSAIAVSYTHLQGSRIGRCGWITSFLRSQADTDTEVTDVWYKGKRRAD